MTVIQSIAESATCCLVAAQIGPDHRRLSPPLRVTITAHARAGTGTRTTGAAAGVPGRGRTSDRGAEADRRRARAGAHLRARALWRVTTSGLPRRPRRMGHRDSHAARCGGALRAVAFADRRATARGARGAR